MDVAIIGTGFIGTTLGNALAGAGFDVVLGSRQDGVGGPGLRTTTVGGALTAAEAVILAIPGSAVASFAAEHAGALDGKLVIDATNTMSGDVPNARGKLPKTVRYARAFSTLGGENFANPVFPDGRADLFFSAPESDRATVESLIDGVGLRPIYVGEDTEDLVDSLFKLWIQLAIKQGRGRHLALRLLED